MELRFIFVIILLHSSVAVCQKNDLNHYNLNGNVCSINSVKYIHVKGLKSKRTEKDIDSLWFRENGSLIKKVHRSGGSWDKKILSWYYYKTNDQYDSCLFYVNDVLTTFYYFFKDENQNIVQMLDYSFDNDTLRHKSDIKLNFHDKLVRSNFFPFNDSKMQEYDSALYKGGDYGYQHRIFRDISCYKRKYQIFEVKDTLGNVISETWKCLKGAGLCRKTKYFHVYQFDDQNNWIKKTTYKGKKVLSVTVREINYY